MQLPKHWFANVDSFGGLLCNFIRNRPEMANIHTNNH